MHHHKTAAVLVAIALASGAALASGTITQGNIGCVSEPLLNEAIGYAVKRDMASLNPLFASGQCAIVKAGQPATVLQSGFMVSQVRYKGAALFVPSEAIR